MLPRANNGSWNSHTCHRRFLTPNSDLSHTRRQDGLVVPRSTWPKNLVIIRGHTCRQRFWIFPTHCHDFRLCSSSIGHTHCPISHVDHRSTYGRNMAFNHCCTRLHSPLRATWVSGFSSTRWWNTHALATRRKLLLMSSNVTG